MAKLAKIVLTSAFDVDSDEQMLKSTTLIAGKGRVRELPGRDAPVPDIELDDDPDHRRVFVRIPGRPDCFIPYEQMKRAYVVMPEQKPVAPSVAIPKMVAQAQSTLGSMDSGAAQVRKR